MPGAGAGFWTMGRGGGLKGDLLRLNGVPDVWLLSLIGRTYLVCHSDGIRPRNGRVISRIIYAPERQAFDSSESPIFGEN